MKVGYSIGACSLGTVLVAASQRGLCGVLFGEEPQALVLELGRRFPKASLERADAAQNDLLARVTSLIEQPRTLLRCPLHLHGTAFQRRVWRALLAIPPGETMSYGELARAIGAPTAARAVARACAANHLSVVIPCHRVVCSDGSLGGYHWGVARKRLLLEREACSEVTRHST